MDLSTLNTPRSLRQQLFAHYSKRCDQLDGSSASKIAWFKRYAKQSYFSHINPYERSASILEIGCSRGYLLSVLQDWGFSALHGIDLSLEDLRHAQTLIPHSHLEHAEGCEYLQSHPGCFDIIIAKAVMEHIEKPHILEFLRACNSALTHRGMLIIDVPNMDWLFAFHERYMDFTHEVGFNCTSLSQVMQEVFPTTTIYPVDFYMGHSSRWKTAIKQGLRCVSRKIIEMLLLCADPESAITHHPIWARSIVGVGYKS